MVSMQRVHSSKAMVKVKHVVEVEYELPRNHYMNMTDEQIYEWEKENWVESFQFLDPESDGINHTVTVVTYNAQDENVKEVKSST